MSLHIAAQPGEIADKILLPGDPLRAKYIAETFLKDVHCYNEIRGMLGFTGTYNGVKISVQGTGMGIPSISIYANELMAEYGVKQLIRVGTCGSIHPDVELKDLVIATGAHTDSAMNADRFGSISFSATPDYDLLSSAVEYARGRGYAARPACVFTSDKFYDDRMEEKIALMGRYGAVSLDMETCELYTLAAKFGCQALSILTVSDHILNGTKVSPQERQTSLSQMVEVALETLCGRCTKEM